MAGWVHMAHSYIWMPVKNPIRWFKLFTFLNILPIEQEHPLNSWEAIAPPAHRAATATCATYG